MQFEDFFDIPKGITRKMNEQINDILPAIFSGMMDIVQLTVLKDSMTVEGGTTTEDALNGCDALGHMATMHQTLGLPATYMSLNVFACGCLLGLLSGDEFAGFLCNEHIARSMNISMDEVKPEAMRRTAVNAIIQKWIDDTGAHIKEHHPDFVDSFRKVDGGKYDFSNIFDADPEQKRHDDIARDLLDE